MKKNIFHIALSLLMTLAVTEYLWHIFFVKDRVSVEIGTGTEETFNEEISETEDLEFENFPIGGDFNGIFNRFSVDIASSVTLKFGKLCTPFSRHRTVKLFIVHCELRLDC
ncbi:MAG: hypothetical protein OEY51_01940 [Cyclobacteriaceae bacterium]|nr:hypothetical protein [Cyclobacteriaceae bacterium]